MKSALTKHKNLLGVPDKNPDKPKLIFEEFKNADSNGFCG